MIADQNGTLYFATDKSGCPTVVDSGHHPYCSQIKKAAEVCLATTKTTCRAVSQLVVVNCELFTEFSHVYFDSNAFHRFAVILLTVPLLST
jgi:hypothetical protein